MFPPNTATSEGRLAHYLTRIPGLRSWFVAIAVIAVPAALAITYSGTSDLKASSMSAEKPEHIKELSDSLANATSDKLSLPSRQPSGFSRESSGVPKELSIAGFMREESGAKPSSFLAPTVSFVSVPGVLPRDTTFENYSPLVSIQYEDLGAETYTLVVHLLETQTGNFNCGGTQSTQMWCPASFTIDNQSGNNSSGRILDARTMNVSNYNGFLWKAELKQSALVVSEALQNAGSTSNRAPVLNPVGNKTVALGQSLDFTVTASDSENDAVSFSAQSLPPGASFNNTTGQFHWQPSTLGTFSSIAFAVTQSGATSLSDAELITIQVTNPPPAGVLAFTAGSYMTGESGPAVLTVTRANGNAGAITVAYSTLNGTAISGSDYTGVSGGTISFADGEATKTIRVSIINDSNVEINEAFQVALSAPTGGATLGNPSQATVTIVDDDTPQLAGQWGGVINLETVPIHIHLLPNGNVMFWDRHNHDKEPAWDVTPRLWDPANPTVFTKLPLPEGWDIFCSGHSLMSDGRLFVAGGHIRDFAGALTAGIYDSVTNSWTALPDMNAGRWYPSSTALANGDTLVLAGTKLDYGDINQLPQVWQINTGTWRNLSSATLGGYPAWADYYPFAYVAPNGKVFVAGPQKTARYLDTTGTGSWTDVANSSLCYRDYGSSVMYNDSKVLIVGGNPRDDCDPSVTPPINPSETAEVINLNDSIPAWRSVASMSVGRRHLNTTILPDGKVLVTGGSSKPSHDDPTGAVLYPELWDPNTETWTPVAAHTRYRGYHSNALLLPDGRVLVAGGGHPDPDGGTAEKNGEIYSPPYLFKGARPTITSAPTTVAYGNAFFVQTPDGASVTSVSWIRLPSVTHAFNQNQRINRLTFQQAPGGLNVTAPANASLCPPGHYMLFILNGNGVPSVAKVVQVGNSLPTVTTTVQFSSTNFSVTESSIALLNVSRSGDASNPAIIDIATSDGTARQSSDYTIASGTLSFAAGETSKNFVILVSDDAYVEGNETINLTLSSPAGVSLGIPATAILTITDNDTQPPTANPIDDARSFVYQHYLDFLSREPDQGGLDFWTNEISKCGSDATCIKTWRIIVSNAFFYEQEFQQTGAYVYRLYRAAFGNDQPSPNPDTGNPSETKKIPAYDVFMQDRARVVAGANQAQEQLDLANAFVQRAQFLARYPAGLSGTEYVDALLTRLKNDSGADLTSQRPALIDLFTQGGRGAVLYRLADDNLQTNPINNRSFIDTEYNRSFVYTQYAGYLRRDSDIGGFLFWLEVVGRFPFRDITGQNAMVCAFITSREYQERFSPIVTHFNSECGP